MVHNHHIVLDGGINKNIKETIVNMFDEEIRVRWFKVSCEVHECLNNIACCNARMEENRKERPQPSERRWKNNSEGFARVHHANFAECEEWFIRRKEQLAILDRLDPDDWIRHREHWSEASVIEKTKQYEYAHTYFNIEKFIPFICINVSPNWKSINRSGKPSAKTQEVFHSAIKEFGECSKRFTELHYVLECGSNGDHLHAHIVAKINPDMEKTCITQLRKGNLSRSFRKFFTKACKDLDYAQNEPEGIGGIVEGKFAIQFSLMRKKEFWKDKTDYLVEDRKPADHKNAYVLEEKRVIYF